MRGLRLLLLTVAMVACLPGGAAAQPASPGATSSDRLAEQFPARLLGESLEVISFSGDELIAGAEDGAAVLELVDVAAQQGVAITDLTIASSSIRSDELFVGLLAASFAGVPAVDVEAELSRLILELDDDVELTPEIIAGRSLTRVGPGSGLTGDSVVHVLPSDDIVWFVVAEDEELEEIVASLP